MRPHWNTEKGVMHLACLRENFTRERTLKLHVNRKTPHANFQRQDNMWPVWETMKFHMHMEKGVFIYATLFSQHLLFKTLDMH